ncbi:hypothetical protein ONS95_003885 [Cadophora gregata]|uniref:uncharacterized protein n=1 Tax=Cadophora gregata TaxID=51156 RepID=UPI0026DD6D78|nr:uncharacterized protein ONS95_003885 [Cadophora gregata]KAK0107180.1 hypothetical protein ONS95_003885 [Cadophora gregata]KAK0116866.1 hypothetical protein ONS96_012713 [Cadophora gregata f. sp. sojae]
MSQRYAPLNQNSTSNYDDEDYLESLQNIPSNFDLALNGNGNNGANRNLLSPQPSKGADASLLEPDALRRSSMSTISSMGGSRNRSVSPYPGHPSTPRTWRESLWSFWDQNQGLFLVTFSQLFGALMNVTTRLLELEGEGMDPFQILFARQGLTAIFCTAWMWYGKVPDFPLGAKGLRGLLCVRSLTGFFGIFGMYYSLQYLPVADAVVITFLAPSVASYGCYLFLREPFPRSAQYASSISLLGVVLIARPTSFFTSSSSSSTDFTTASNTTTISTDPTDPSSFPVPTSSQRLSAVAIAMIGVLGSAGAFTSIRWIGNRAHPLLSVNYFSIFCTVISTLALSLAKPLHLSNTLHFALPAGLRQWSMLIFLGVCGFVMQYLLTRGLAAGGRGNGARATNMIYTNMLFALGLDKLVFGQSPGWWSLAGSGLILGSAIFVAVKKGQAQGQGQSECAAGERGTDVEMFGRRESARSEEEIAMLGGAEDDESEEEEMEFGPGLENGSSKGVIEAGR